MKIENIQNSITKLLSCLYSYFLTMSISQLVSFFISKTILTYTGSELENKRINCEKTGFRAMATRRHDVTKMSCDTKVGHSNRMCGIFTV